MTLRQHTFALLVAAGALVLVACSREEEKPADKGPPPPTVIGAEDVARAERGAIETGPRIAGSLEARNKAVVRAEVGGSVLAVDAELGEPVKKGQIIARIEARTLAQSVASAQAAVRTAARDRDVAQREVERTEALVAGGALAERDLDSAQSALVAAQSRLSSAQSQLGTTQSQLGDATVKAPIDGVVSERAVSQGDVVALGAQLFTIIDPTSMRLEASVPSESLSALTVGAPVTFSVRGYPGRSFTGKIERIAPAADPVTRQISILVDIPNPGGELVAGLFADGRVAAKSHQALILPTSAIDDSGTSPTVTAVVDGEVKKVPVTIGLRDSQAEVVEIESGLEPGQVVLLHGARDLPPGTRVTLDEATAAAAAATALSADAASATDAGPAALD